MILVCGFGRCGSSLVMQLLYRAGVQCGGYWPSFEDPRATEKLPHDIAWLSEYKHGALKILDPVRFLPEHLHLNAIGIWLHRDPIEQAKSYVKVQRNIQDLSVNRLDRSRQAKLFRRTEQANIARVAKVCGTVHHMRFEHLISRPIETTTALLNTCELGADPELIAAGIVSRDPSCRKSLLERDLVRVGANGVHKLDKHNHRR